MLDPLPIEPLTAPPHAVVRVPGSKSLTNRALVCALLAEGRSTITGALDADDTRAMAGAVSALGASVEWEGDVITVEPPASLRPGPLTVHVRDSGTCARFLAPVLALGSGPYVLDGSDQLRRRPMGPMVEALRSLGVVVEGESLPLTIHGCGGLPDEEVVVPGDVSSQFISGLLLAGARVRPAGEVVSAPYIKMTSHVLAAFADGGTTYAVEPDATAASYFYAVNSLFPDGRVSVDGLDPATSIQGDVGFVEVLRQMPADVDLRDMPDVAQTLAAVAVFGDHPVRVRGIGFVRGHETDRIAAVVTELRRCGIESEEHDDGFTVHPGTPQPAVVETYGDHRMAMSFALLGLRVPGIAIKNPACVAKTFPEFFSVLETLRR